MVIGLCLTSLSFPLPFLPSQDTQPDSLVVQLDATDEDSGENGEFTFRIVNQASNPNFFLDINTGMLQTVGTLDRETTELYTVIKLETVLQTTAY